MLISDRSNLDELCFRIQQDLRRGKKVVEPFGYQGISTSESDLLLSAQIFSKTRFPAIESDGYLRSAYKNNKLRLGISVENLEIKLHQF